MFRFRRKPPEPPSLDDEACREHQDRDCRVCQRYVLTVVTWEDRRMTQEFWAGQKAGIEWGPMGMEDAVYVAPVVIPAGTSTKPCTPSP